MFATLWPQVCPVGCTIVAYTFSIRAIGEHAFSGLPAAWRSCRHWHLWSAKCLRAALARGEPAPAVNRLL